MINQIEIWINKGNHISMWKVLKPQYHNVYVQKGHKFGIFPNFEKHRKISFSDDLVKSEDDLSNSFVH